MRVVIVGGAGFIGKNLSIQLVNQGYEVVIIDRPGNAFEKKALELGIKYIDGDYITGNGLKEGIQEDDCVIHLVSTSVPNSSNQDIYIDAQDNILPAIRLLDICKQKKVRKVIFASSGGTVYGIPQFLPIDEFHVTNPTSAYGIHKLTVEKYLLLYKELFELNVCILRIANPYGPGQIPFRGQGVVATFLASVLLNKEIQVWGDGNSVRDYIYIDDLGKAFIKAIEYSGNEVVFNIGSGIGISVKEILEIIDCNINAAVNVKYIPAKIVDVKSNILKCEKASKILNWRVNTDIREGVQKMIESWDENQQQFIV